MKSFSFNSSSKMLFVKSLALTAPYVLWPDIENKKKAKLYPNVVVLFFII